MRFKFEPNNELESGPAWNVVQYDPPFYFGLIRLSDSKHGYVFDTKKMDYNADELMELAVFCSQRTEVWKAEQAAKAAKR